MIFLKKSRLNDKQQKHRVLLAFFLPELCNKNTFCYDLGTKEINEPNENISTPGFKVPFRPGLTSIGMQKKLEMRQQRRKFQYY